MIVEFVTTVLQDAGHEVRSDLVGLTAISEIAACRPDVVLTDLMMAAVDGLALCRELRRKPRLNRTAVIFMTSRTEMVWRDQAAAAGADGRVFVGAGGGTPDGGEARGNPPFPGVGNAVAETHPIDDRN